jgi:putative ABC transport system permease protein
MSYALTILWCEKNRYLPAVLAVTFSALLMLMQFGLLLGIFSELSVPIERSRADVWVGYPGVPSADFGLPIPEGWGYDRVAAQPGVDRVEPYIRGLLVWGKPGGGVAICTTIGTRLDEGALGPIRELTPELRIRLAEPDTIVVDESELDSLGLQAVGDVNEVNGTRVRLVGLVNVVKGVMGPYIFCSLRTARNLLRLPDGQATFLLASCRNRADAPAVAEQLRKRYPRMSAFSSEDLAQRTRRHWLTKTKFGVALGFAACLGLVVGGAVTSQTLYAATAASLRQFATLEALGIPTWRMSVLVASQAFWVGLLGIGVALPAALGLAWIVLTLGAKFLLPPALIVAAVVLTMLMALISGLLALRSLRLAQPAVLLR